MQVNSVNNVNPAFCSRNVMVNPAVLNSGEKKALKPVLDMVEDSAIDEKVLRSFMEGMPKLQPQFIKMLNSAKSPAQEYYNTYIAVKS